MGENHSNKQHLFSSSLSESLLNRTRQAQTCLNFRTIGSIKMDFASINRAARCEGPQSTTVKAGDLTIGTAYEIKTIRRVETRFGEAIVVALVDIGDLFLPKRFTKILTADVIAGLLESKRPTIRRCEICNIDVQSLGYSGHLSSAQHKENALMGVGKCRVIRSEFRKRLISYRIDNDTHLDSEAFFMAIKPELQRLMGDEISQHKSIRVNTELFATYILEAKEKSDIKNFNTRSIILNDGSDLGEAVNSFIDTIRAKMVSFELQDSGWSVGRCLHIELNIAKFNPLSGSTFIPLPKDVASKHAIINIKNRDAMCFKWAILAQLHPGGKNAGRVSKYSEFEDELNFKNIDFPVKLSQIRLFERLNESISINVYGLDKVGDEHEVVGPLYLTSERCRPTHVNLLLIDNDDGIHHYCLIKSLPRLLSSQLSKNGHPRLLCHGCLQYFTSELRLAEHRRGECGEVRVELPIGKRKNRMGDVVERNILKFESHHKQLEVPFVIYFDFEALLQPLVSCSPDPNASYNLRKAVNIPYSFGYNIKCAYDDSLSVYRNYRGEDAPKKFIEWIEADVRRIYDKHLKIVVPMPELSPQEKLDFDQATECGICNVPFKANELRVRDHCHLTGRFRNACHNSCNINFKVARFIPCVCHNLSRYDAHLFIKALAEAGSNLQAIAINKETYIAFSRHIVVDHSSNNRAISIEIRFIDSFRFLSSSLDKLAQNLADENCHEVRKGFPKESHFQLIRRKGVFPYSFIDSFEKLNLQALPSKADFFNDMSGEEISDDDYARAHTVWDAFNCKTIGDYSDIYLQSDCLLLTDVFEEYRKIAQRAYGLDPAQFYTAPGLSWSAMMRYTKIELELICEIEILNFVKSGVRGGICQCNVRKALANNQFLPNFNPSEPKSFIMYLDATNLYGSAMCGYLPYGKFSWVEDPSQINIDTILNYKFKQDVGYLFEVDLDYPAELHNLHDDLPFCVESMIPPGSSSKQRKLITNLNNKRKYVIHYMNLQQALQNGLKLVRIHRVLSFKQKPWLQPYIELNTELRNAATSKAAKDHYKRKNNSIYGKTMESVDKRVDVKLLTHWGRVGRRPGIEAAVSKPNFKNFTIFNENFAAVQMCKTRIVNDKPIYTGLVILELSKYIMYDFLYNYIKKKYGDKSRLLYMDTDSFVLQIYTDNFYRDIQNNLDKFDTSNYPANNIHNITPNRSVIGRMKDEYGGAIISEFLGTGPKAYCVDIAGKLTKRAKGVKMATVKHNLSKSDYDRAATIPGTSILREMYNFRSMSHTIYLNMQNKVALSYFDDKLVLRDGSYQTTSWGHFKLSGDNGEVAND